MSSASLRHAHALCTAVLLLVSVALHAQEIKISGVHQGKSLYVQNPLLPDKKTFCITSISVNHKMMNINYLVSAIELSFDNVELFSPVTIRIMHHQGCSPIVLNPEAVRFHSTFTFREVALTDSSLVWKTRGEKQGSTYEIEKLYMDGWSVLEQLDSRGVFAGSEYSIPLDLEEGSNKFRVKYVQYDPDRVLFSEEIELVYYPEPITIHPFTVTDKLYISRICEYEISTVEGKVILTGKGKEVMLKNLRRGEYYITIGDKVEKFVKN